jgi:hypothetical protein
MVEIENDEEEPLLVFFSNLFLYTIVKGSYSAEAIAN